MGGEWREARLGEVAEVRSGFAFKSSDMGSEGMPLIKIKNITPPTVNVEDVQRVPEDIIRSIPRVERYRLEHQDILIAMTGATVGKVGRFPRTNEFFYLNQRVGKVYLKYPNNADYDFIYYVLAQPDYVQHMFGLADGSAQANISGTQIEQLELPLPPFPEQRAIAHILGTLDDKIELNRRMNKTLEEMARAVFKSWFVDFDPVRAKAAARRQHPKWSNEKVSRAACPDLEPDLAALFPDAFQDSELGEVPEGWEVGTVDSCFDLTMGQSPPGSTYNEDGDGLPFYQGRADFTFRFPTRRVYCTAPKRFAQKGDTLISVRAPVGDINMAGEDCAIGRGVAAIRHKTGSRSFTYYAMRSFEGIFARFEAEGTVFGSIGKRDFHALKSVAPSRILVARFEVMCSPKDSAIELNEEASRTLSALRDALLPKLISGELRVKDAERIAARAG